MTAVTAADREYPEVLQDLADNITEFMIEAGEDPLDAAAMGLRIAERVRLHYGGLRIYIPKANRYLLSQRDLEIFDLWNGANTKDLCERFGLTGTRIYQIIQKVRQERQREGRKKDVGKNGTSHAAQGKKPTASKGEKRD